MMLLEFSVAPLGKGQSVAEYVARAVDIVDRSGLDYELHAMGTIVEGELDQLLPVLKSSLEALAKDCDRITLVARFDHEKGEGGRLKKQVESVEKKLGRKLKT